MRESLEMRDEPILTVVDTVPEHVRILGQNLRDRDIEMANNAGILAHRALWRVWRRSMMAKTVFVDDEIVAMFGCVGIFLGRKGKPWFIASPYVEDYPMKLAFRYRSELRKMLKYFPVLEDWIQIQDEKTIRFMEILGFVFAEPEKIGNVTFMKATLEK